MNSKYAKYSTEQLEVIISHLADPAEKELVKKELSQRYYQHYLGLDTTPGNELQPGAEAGLPGAEEAADDQAAAEGSPGAEELEGLQEVGPITLTAPADPETTPKPAAKPTDKAAKKKYCFIATAAYGSPLAREVVLLQTYRDDYLAGNPLGERFIRAYYRFGPFPAELIREHESLKLLARCLLTPVILLIKKITARSSRS